MALINDFYIIESLRENEIRDGNVFYKTIKLIDDKFYPTYNEVNNLIEFEKAIKDFSNSKFKFLLISSHGDFENFFLNEDSVNSYDLEDMEVDLMGRRIFLSTCEGGSYLIARYLILKGAYSVIGTSIELRKIIAVAFWPTMFLHFEKHVEKVGFKVIDRTLKNLVKIYQIPLHYFSFVGDEKKMKEYIYKIEERRKRINHNL